MGLTVTLVVCAVVLCGFIALWIRHRINRRDIENYRMTPETLRNLMESAQQVLIYDVRQPLDLLANSEIIPGATRVPPKELVQNPQLIPKDKDLVVYCTCPSDKTSREVLQKALAMDIFRVKFLEGGLAGWKAKGYPVEPYRESFHLDTAR
jgi:rhodanese-related sulfurtransferase